MTFQKKTWNGNIPQLLPHYEQPFFQDAASFPFRYNLSRYSEVNAWWMAEAAGLAYFDAPKIEKTLGDHFKVTFFEDLETETQGFLLACPQFGILSFRGTEVALKPDFPTRIENPRAMLQDIITDLEVKQEPWDGSGLVHSGFLKAYSTILPAVREALDISTPETLWLTGHSLGGAIATLMADSLFRKEYPVRALYTIGSPRPGNPEFSRNFPVPAYRFVHGKDVLSLLPPDIMMREDYTPVGEMLYLDERGHIHPQGHRERELMPFLARELGLNFSSFFGGNLFGNATRLLTDHSPLHYRNHLWNDMIS